MGKILLLIGRRLWQLLPIVVFATFVVFSLLQLVPGVAINRNFSEGDDNSAPILGERANNAYILIDGMPNRDEVDGGPAGQFDQDSILEFQVLTSGYKAEFGRGSGGVVNVATRSGTKQWHGSFPLF